MMVAMIDKHARPTKLFWIDLEMTGLDPDNDVILEIACEVTDFDLKTLSSYEATITQPRELVIERMKANTWWQEYPENRDEFINKLSEGKALKVVEDELIKLVSENAQDEPAIIAGNSIHNDRKFIAKWWPELELKLHYRMLDVSAWKVYMQGRFDLDYEKPELHRAYEDIQASIAELQYYLEWLRNGSQDG